MKHSQYSSVSQPRSASNKKAQRLTAPTRLLLPAAVRAAGAAGGHVGSCRCQRRVVRAAHRRPSRGHAPAAARQPGAAR
eukprot:339123-Chlamydomonas_euryale.AAC.1